MILLAWALNWVARRAYVPSIVSYLAAGLAVVPLASWLGGILPPGLTFDAGSESFPATIGLIGQAGIVLLLFIVGLELSLDQIKGVGKVAVYAGLGQVVFTAVGGFILAWALGFNAMESAFLGFGLTFSSTVVVVKLLDQKRELDSLYGRIAVGIFLVQNLVVILALTFLSALDAAESLDFWSLARSLGVSFAGVAVLLAISILASRRLLQGVFGWAAGSPETLLMWSIGWCFLYVLAAEGLGMSAELGAFLAGVSLAQLECSQDLRRRIHPLMNFFVAVFFISLGAQLPLEAAVDFPIESIVLSLFVLIGNPLIFILIITHFGYSRKICFLTGVTVAQISEFSFVFAAKGVATGFVGEPILGVTAVVGIATIALSSYLILYNHQLFRIMDRWGLLGFVRSEGMEEAAPARFSDHWVVVGANALGRQLVRSLSDRGEKVVCVDRDPGKLRGLPGYRVQGSVEYLSVLEEAGLPKARFAVSALRIQDINNLFAFRCKQLGVPVAIHAFDRSVAEELERLDVDHLINSKRAGVDAFARLLGTFEERHR